MGQLLWINISDKPHTFYKCCMNENCQLSIKEYLCWVSFWSFTFLWEETKFNATFILSRRYTLRSTIFFAVTKGVTSFHSFVRRQFLLDKYEICSLSEQILLFNPAFEIAWNLDRMRDMMSWSLVFFLPQSLLRKCQCDCSFYTPLYSSFNSLSKCIHDVHQWLLYWWDRYFKVSDCTRFEWNTLVTTQQPSID